MQDNFYLLIVEHDNFYDTKEFDSYLFKTKEDAIEYMNDLIESYIVHYSANYDCSIEELLNEYVELTRSSDTYVNWYIDDDCNIEFYVEEKPLLKFKQEEE